MQKFFIVSVLICIALSALNANANSPTAQGDIIRSLRVDDAKKKFLTSLPPPPDPVAAKKSIAGVDVNENGVRDDLELSLAEITLYAKGRVTHADFYQLLEVVKFLHPSEKVKVINLSRFYCDYRMLDAGIQKRISESMMINLVTNSIARKNAFFRQLANAADVMDAGNCY